MEEHLDQAKENIEKHYLAVGINEKFDESILLIANKLGWKKQPYYRIQNLNKSNRPTSVSDEDLEIVKQYNQLDIELYEHQLAVFEEQKRAIPDFDKKLATFKRKNKMYQTLSAPLSWFSK